MIGGQDAMKIKTAAVILLGSFAGLSVSIMTAAMAHAEVFIMCPSGQDGVATEVTSCEFADNVRRAWQSQYGPVVLAYSPVTGNVYNMQCAGGFTAHMNNGMVIDTVRCVGGNNAVVVLW
jgi:hypothetical protein